jgi:hypothetical protein
VRIVDQDLGQICMLTDGITQLTLVTWYTSFDSYTLVFMRLLAQRQARLPARPSRATPPPGKAQTPVPRALLGSYRDASRTLNGWKCNGFS